MTKKVPHERDRKFARMDGLDRPFSRQVGRANVRFYRTVRGSGSAGAPA